MGLLIQENSYPIQKYQTIKQKMLQKKGGLKLNSYKIDTQALQSSLRELSEMKQQLQTTISYYKTHEDQLLVENERLKQQISMLQKKTENRPDHNKCNQTIIRLQGELKQQKKQTGKYRQMLEAEKKNNKITQKQYEQKLEKYMTESKILTDNYEQRIASLNVQLKQAKILIQMHKEEKIKEKQQSEKVFKKKQNKYKESSSSENMRSQSQNQYIPLVTSKNQNLSQKQQKNLPVFGTDSNQSYKYEQKPKNPPIKSQVNFSSPPKSPSSAHREYKTSHEITQHRRDQSNYPEFYTASYLPNQQDEQIFQASIRKLYIQIKDLGISARQAQVLPQFKKMASNKSPSRKDLFNFMKNPPVEQKNNKNIQKSINFLQNTIRNKYGKLSGNYVTQLIISRVQQYQNLSKLNTQDLEISGVTPSSSSSYAPMKIQSQRYHHGNNINNHTSSNQFNNYMHSSRPSIQDNLRIQSQSSMFR